jgi:uncharacterized membrane protein YgaE (UPF0421/DUF939 family)
MSDRNDERGTVEQILDVLLAVLIGVAIAMALAYWWSA